MANYDPNDPFWFLNADAPEPEKENTPLEPATDHSADDIDPKLVRNTTPYQSIEYLAELLERTGIPTEWERSFPCPCINPASNQPRSDCPICHGRGLAYRKGVYLNVAYQSNEKGPYQGAFGSNDIGTTMATPQLTENGIENGISFMDRLTIKGLTISQSYIFNVSDTRLTDGVFIPYHVLKFDYVATADTDGNLLELSEGVDFSYNKRTSRMTILNRSLVGKSVSMSITTWLRYYVSAIKKETRYAQVKKQQEKEVAMNYGNQRLTNYIHTYKEKLAEDISYYRLPKQLVLKREDLFLGAADFDAPTNNTKTNSNYIDTNSGTGFTDFLGVNNG